jgi:hypothetical protein
MVRRGVESSLGRTEIQMALQKIISGGQTGVDRGALGAALAAAFPCGGWCPADRQAEDGPIPDFAPRAGAREMPSGGRVVISEVVLMQPRLPVEELTGQTQVVRQKIARRASS